MVVKEDTVAFSAGKRASPLIICVIGSRMVFTFHFQYAATSLIGIAKLTNKNIPKICSVNNFFSYLKMGGRFNCVSKFFETDCCIVVSNRMIRLALHL